MQPLKMLAAFSVICMFILLLLISSHLQAEYNRTKINEAKSHIASTLTGENELR
jgi:hypothetical protein